ncbi:hypothetical protein Rsub_04803 [Raphidocelis subcapitata]|uniref:Uncharacterized protein n=1 Tax=Raphidocelis subcapitata TaxID=307507 RepID=A0A2V0NU21_9CHLO|nr:hypothetical protein Rsub_04803 [Raphidocelis subcapitata]|eukprot:GBF91134.1 hypothetical protein Rsub_04803 [Raphidocelis subcapitata]
MGPAPPAAGCGPVNAAPPPPAARQDRHRAAAAARLERPRADDGGNGAADQGAGDDTLLRLLRRRAAGAEECEWQTQIDRYLAPPASRADGVSMLRRFVARRLEEEGERRDADGRAPRRGGRPLIWVDELVPRFQRYHVRRLDPAFFGHDDLTELLCTEVPDARVVRLGGRAAVVRADADADEAAARTPRRAAAAAGGAAALELARAEAPDAARGIASSDAERRHGRHGGSHATATAAAAAAALAGITKPASPPRRRAHSPTHYPPPPPSPTHGGHATATAAAAAAAQAGIKKPASPPGRRAHSPMRYPPPPPSPPPAQPPPAEPPAEAAAGRSWAARMREAAAAKARELLSSAPRLRSRPHAPERSESHRPRVGWGRGADHAADRLGRVERRGAAAVEKRSGTPHRAPLRFPAGDVDSTPAKPAAPPAAAMKPHLMPWLPPTVGTGVPALQLPGLLQGQRGAADSLAFPGLAGAPGPAAAGAAGEASPAAVQGASCAAGLGPQAPPAANEGQQMPPGCEGTCPPAALHDEREQAATLASILAVAAGCGTIGLNPAGSPPGPAAVAACPIDPSGLPGPAASEDGAADPARKRRQRGCRASRGGVNKQKPGSAGRQERRSAQQVLAPASALLRAAFGGLRGGAGGGSSGVDRAPLRPQRTTTPPPLALAALAAPAAGGEGPMCMDWSGPDPLAAGGDAVSAPAAAPAAPALAGEAFAPNGEPPAGGGAASVDAAALGTAPFAAPAAAAASTPTQPISSEQPSAPPPPEPAGGATPMDASPTPLMGATPMCEAPTARAVDGAGRAVVEVTIKDATAFEKVMSLLRRRLC